MDAFPGEGDERRAILVLSDGKDSGMIGFGNPWRARRASSSAHAETT
jgi:hypothetical protein